MRNLLMIIAIILAKKAGLLSPNLARAYTKLIIEEKFLGNGIVFTIADIEAIEKGIL
jgi:hypothetical protein